MWPFINNDRLGLERHDKDENKDNNNLIPLHSSKLGELGNLEPGFDFLPSFSSVNISARNTLNAKLVAKQNLVVVGLQENSIHLTALHRHTFPM